jgi:hypothetical protein
VDDSPSPKAVFPIALKTPTLQNGNGQDIFGFQAMATSSQSVFLCPLVVIAMPFSATACEIQCALSTNTIQRVKHDVQMIW